MDSLSTSVGELKGGDIGEHIRGAVHGGDDFVPNLSNLCILEEAKLAV
jgi:hypothetical protein